MIFIPKDNIDSQVWDVTDKFLHREDKSNLTLNNFIKVEVINKRVNQGDHQIKVIGKVLDYATNEEVEKFFGSVIHKEDLSNDTDNASDKEEENNFII